jgi:hypothetical protein
MRRWWRREADPPNRSAKSAKAARSEKQARRVEQWSPRFGGHTSKQRRG